jgi:hypothetical protein
VLPARPEAPEERPEKREIFATPIILAYALGQWSELRRNALMILLAHAVAGRPAERLTTMDYPTCSEVVRDAVHWSTGLDPAAGRERLQASDADESSRRVLVKGWKELRSDGSELPSPDAS